MEVDLMSSPTSIERKAPRGVSEEDWAKMSLEERVEHLLTFKDDVILDLGRREEARLQTQEVQH
jgi:hypothetical protein